MEPDELFSFGGVKSNDDLYQNILKYLETIKNDRNKLTVINSILKNLI